MKPDQPELKPARFRKLRIAWSVGWGLAAAVMIIMWVRSHTAWDRCYWPGNNLGVQLNSDAGHIVLVVGPPAPTSNIEHFFVASLPTYDESATFYKDNVWGFHFARLQNGFRLDVPYWFCTLLSTALAIVPWRRQIDGRFQLRTLLIATTLVAAVLGMALWAAKW